MRHFSRALNSEISKYRKRKRISLDGSLPGLPIERDLHWRPKTLQEIAPEMFLTDEAKEVAP